MGKEYCFPGFGQNTRQEQVICKSPPDGDFFLTFFVRCTIINVTMRLIKRYKNRRLYDTRTSRTITQFDLARMIEGGEEEKVVDSTTGEDITVPVMARVIGERSTVWGSVADAKEVLRSIIYLGGNKSMSILRNTVLASIGALHVTKAKAEKIIDELIKKGELDKSDRKKAVMELLDKAEKSTTELRKKIAREAEKAQKGVSKLASGFGWANQDDVKKLDAKVKRLAKKVKAGADFIQTQAIYDVAKFAKWMQIICDRGLDTQVHILAGVIPIRSVGMARYMKDYVSGISVPDELITRLEEAKTAKEEGLKIAIELIEQLKEIPGVHGIHIMAVGWEDIVPEILGQAGLLPRPVL